MTDAIPGIFRAISEDVVPQADVLRDLDSQIGDGDLGITITRGMESVIAGLDELEGKPASDQLARSGMAFNRAAASTFGVLFATAMMRGGAAVKDKNAGQTEIVAIGRAALQGLMDRGKASVGDKTLLDALAPAIDAFDAAQQEGKSLVECTDAAVTAAEKGMNATTAMRSKVSRASWVGERSIGVQDPGATAVTFMLKAAQRWVHENA